MSHTGAAGGGTLSVDGGLTRILDKELTEAREPNGLRLTSLRPVPYFFFLGFLVSFFWFLPFAI